MEDELHLHRFDDDGGPVHTEPEAEAEVEVPGWQTDGSFNYLTESALAEIEARHAADGPEGDVPRLVAELRLLRATVGV